MNRGTRRMWSRRVLRAGWIVAPILAAPGKVWRHFVHDHRDRFNFGQFVGTMFLLALVTGIPSCVYRDHRLDSVATAQEIEEALDGNACMIDLMPRRAAIDNKGAPLTNRDLMIGGRDCEAAWTAANQIEQQKLALKKMGAK